jgi:hypothetical protein
MPEIGMSVSMSGDGKRGVGHRPQATAPILDSTISVIRARTFLHRKASYSITSVARSSVAVGTSMPIALAALRFTTVSNLTGS